MKKINDFIITSYDFDCVEIVDVSMNTGIQMTIEEAELIACFLKKETEYLKNK